MPIDVRPTHEYETLLKSVVEKQPEDVLRILFDMDLGGRELVRETPTEQQRQLSRGKDVVFLLRHDEDDQDRAAEQGRPIPKHDVCHIEVQAEREDGFQEWLARYWMVLAERYDESRYRVNQLVAWPLGGGYDGVFRRDGLELRYSSVNLPAVDPARMLSSPLATLALWPKAVG